MGLKCGLSHFPTVIFPPFRSLELAKSMVLWREGFFPVRDDEKDIRPMLDSGVMYWVGRDQAMRPLLIIRSVEFVRA